MGIVTFSVIMNDKKVTISQFYDLFRNYEWQKDQFPNFMTFSEIMNDKKVTI